MSGYLDNTEITVDQKFARALLELRELRPFYSALYEAMKHMESKKVPTMGVTSDTMFYNYDFVDKLTYGEFLFVNLHEIGHVALMHPSRIEYGMDKELSNIAADLIVNKLLADEFSITPGKTSNSGITMPKDAVYSDLIDIEKDSMESIYYKLLKQAEQNGYTSDTFKSVESEYNNQQNGQQGSGNDQQGSGNDQQGQQGKQSNQQGQQSAGSGKGQKNSQNGNNGQQGNGANTYQKIYTFTIEKDGKKDSFNVSKGYCNDLLDDGGDSNEKINRAKSLLADAKTRCELNNKFAGDGHCSLELMVSKFFESRIDWRKWLSKYVIASKSTDTSFSKPDKRMFYQSAIYPGQAVDEANQLKGVKICIDTSGSISDEDLQYIFGHVYKLCKTYKVEAEIIAWDTEIESCGKIRPDMSLKNLNLSGGGGTDPSCVFEYFDSKKCKVKPIVTLMFTDGYIGFRGDQPKWHKKYKDTLWVLTKDGDKDFKAPFGKKADIRY